VVDYKGVNKEEVEGGKITALSQVRVTCRYRTDINEQQRIIWMNKYYQIENVQISEDNMYLHLFCSFAQKLCVMFISQAKLNRLKRLEGKTNKKGQPLAISNLQIVL
jgi:hypothetical protein